MKQCSKCKQWKPLTEYYKHESHKDGVRSQCKNCEHKTKQSYYQKNKERILIKNKEYHKKYVNSAHGKKVRETYRLKPETKKRQNELKRKRSEKYKKIVFEHYTKGKIKCQLCGIDNYDLMTLDHINGGGTNHRKEVGRSQGKMYYWIIKNNFPSGFRVLCRNCNWLEFIKNKLV